jgi:hypothetical protein
MMATEERVDLHARRRGFKLLRQRGDMTYSLRLIRDASLVLSELPNGRFGFAPLRCGRNREACWLPLSSIALLLGDQELVRAALPLRGRRRKSSYKSAVGAAAA